MKSIYIIAIISLFISCGDSNMNIAEKYIVQTTVNLQPGKTDDVLKLFKSTNPKLVSDQSDWIRATFSVVEDQDVVIVNAEWKSKESYFNFSNSQIFKETMGNFGKYFKGKPKVTITKVLYEM